jgi:hypothetical protein
MKNAKLLLLSALTIVSLSLTSCGDDDSDSTSGSIEGKWAYNQIGAKLNGKEQLIDYPYNQTGCDKDYIEVDATTIKYASHDTDCSVDIDSETYTKSGNTITTGTGEDAVTSKITKLTGSELKIESTYTEGGETTTEVTTFTKVK